jgi:glycosyltransferase involved in cell wall biosynthesis
MNQAICGVIPCFNNVSTAPDTVKAALSYLDHVIFVDDGSTDGTASSLSDHARLTVLSHRENRGKGAAVKTGAAHAIRSNFTHILQMDADGQHNPDDIPRFLSTHAQNPEALLVASRANQDALPPSSQFGRWFGNLWFKLETLGCHLSDTQCGFRLYPLSLFECAQSRCNRMDFDVEILVLAARLGFRLIDMPVTVTYFEGDERVSHFLPFLDNLLMSKLHFRMTWSLLVQWPSLLESRRLNR